MQAQDRVRTSDKWNRKYYWKGSEGTILQVASKGPVKDERNHQVKLDYPLGGWTKLWFDPNDLELIDDKPTSEPEGQTQQGLG